MTFVIALFLYFAVCVLTASLADRRGRSFWVYLVFCFFLPVAILPAWVYLLLFARNLRPKEAV